MSEPPFDPLTQGRIIALELLFRELLATRLIRESDKPLAAANRYKTLFLGSLQNADWGMPNERADAVWEAAQDAVRIQLEQVIYRINSMQQSGTLPPDA